LTISIDRQRCSDLWWADFSMWTHCCTCNSTAIMYTICYAFWKKSTSCTSKLHRWICLQIGSFYEVHMWCKIDGAYSQCFVYG